MPDTKRILAAQKEKKKRKIFLLREAAKKIVSDLRNQSPFFSKALNAEIFVTKKYLQHILLSSFVKYKKTPLSAASCIITSQCSSKGIF